MSVVLFILFMSLTISQSLSGTHVQPAVGCRFRNAHALQHPPDSLLHMGVKLTSSRDTWLFASLRRPGFESRRLSIEMFEHRIEEQLAPWDLLQEEGQRRKEQKECRKH